MTIAKIKTFPFEITEVDFKDKSTAISNYVKYMFARTQAMFEYSGLPETIPQRMLELYLQSNGNTCIAQHNGELYAFTGGMGGEPDPYYMPTIYTVSNPALNFSKMFKIGVDCVVIPSDSLYMGLFPMFKRYASLMVENDITMRIADINMRITSIISSEDARTAQAAQKYIEDIEKGEMGVVAESALVGAIKTNPYSSSGSSSSLTQLVEYQQYLKAGWFNDIGLQSNYNMKRERINSVEAQLDTDALLPFVQDMLTCRKKGVEQVNKMFGTSISVELGSSWADRHDSGQPENDPVIDDETTEVVENEDA